ncbi:MAG TPA: GntR family transcriptional regulator [Cyclobacteriaceae bacterium]|nr:GntR family transcriptional regulator [Cyclobacteriaceae bacterium]
MKFRDSQPIYLQIAEYACEKILLNEWKPGDRVPSIRDLAVELEVNPNTVMRTYDFLQTSDIIYNERGVGLFVGPKASRNALDYLQNEFTQNSLPHLFRRLALLEMDVDSLKPFFDKYMKKNFKSLTSARNENK